MQRMKLLIFVGLVAVAGAGCIFNIFREVNKDYCERNLMALSDGDRKDCCDAHPSLCEVGGPCEGPNDCESVETPYCQLDRGVCVQCLESAQCTEVQPICDLQTNACVGCRVHADCASNLCLDDGTCAREADVAYVSDTNAAANNECVQDRPCENLGQALALTPPRKYIKASGMISAGTTIDGVAAIVYGAPGATILTHTMNGAVLIINNKANVALFDLEITGGPNGNAVEVGDKKETTFSMTRVKVRAPNGNGISISDGTVTVADSEVFGSSLAGVNVTKGALVMERSRVIGNMQEGIKVMMGGMGAPVEIRRSRIAGNQGTAGVLAMGASMVTIESSVITLNTGMNGGVSIVGPLAIRNSIISRNGGGGTMIGGLLLNSTNATFEFNTVADNLSSSGFGLSCALPINVASSILTGNGVNGCNVTHSLADSVLPGTGNMVGAPMFLSTDATDPANTMFYRIGAGSPARDNAGPSSIPDDIDGDPRPLMGKDMGADEFR